MLLASIAAAGHYLSPNASLARELHNDRPGECINNLVRQGKAMLRSLSQLFGFAKESSEMPEFEPIYGLPRRSLDDWLSRNPGLKHEYEAKLRDRCLSHVNETSQEQQCPS